MDAAQAGDGVQQEHQRAQNNVKLGDCRIFWKDKYYDAEARNLLKKFWKGSGVPTVSGFQKVSPDTS